MQQAKWKNWQMYEYVVEELPTLLRENFTELDTSPASIFGHGMGGHGALTIYLKNLDKYKSVSAFAPIANPTNCPCGMTAFINYLGENKDDWMEYDATCLVSRCNNNNVSGSILIDQVEADELLSKNELLPEEFESMHRCWCCCRATSAIWL